MLIAIFFIYCWFFVFYPFIRNFAGSTEVETYNTCRIINWQRIITLGIYLTFFSAILWQSKVNFYCQMDFLFGKCSRMSIISCKYGLIFSRYCLIYSFLSSFKFVFDIPFIEVVYSIFWFAVLRFVIIYFWFKKLFFFAIAPWFFTDSRIWQWTNHTKYFLLIVWSCHFPFFKFIHVKWGGCKFFLFLE